MRCVGELGVGEQPAHSWLAQDLIHRKFPGEAVRLSVVREGARLEFSVNVTPIPPLVLDTLAARPTYVVYAGLVLVPLSIPLLESLGDGDWEAADDELCVVVRNRQRKFAGEEIVVLSRILTHDVNFGYEDMELLTLTSINGAAVANLRHAHALLRDCSTPLVELLFGESNLVCLDRVQSLAANKTILAQHKIPSDTNLHDFPE